MKKTQSQILLHISLSLRSHPISIVKPPAALPAPGIITIGNKESRTGLRKCNLVTINDIFLMFFICFGI